MIAEPKPVLRYPGSKARIAKWIISHFPKHESYVEPFMGSLTILCAKPRCPVEVVNDIDGDVVNFFRVVRDQPEELSRVVEMTPWSREEHALSFQPADDPLERARRVVVRFWQTMGADFGAKSWRVGWSAAPGKLDVDQWRELTGRVMATAERLRGVHIENRPASDILQRCRSRDVFVYADPPYLHSTRDAALYEHDMGSEAEHEELLAILKDHPGPVVLSGYDNPLYRHLLPDWTMLATKARTIFMGERTEVIWLNPVAADSTSQQALDLT